MTQLVSRLEELTTQLPQAHQANAVTEHALDLGLLLRRPAAGAGNLMSADESARFDNVRLSCVSYKPMSFADQCCPICRSFGCGVC